MDEKIKQKLENQQYRIVGNHSAVKICNWTKKSLIDNGECYKSKFYSIPTHRCCQMTPSMFCPNKCQFCWRSIEHFNAVKLSKSDEPKDIVDGCIEGQRHLLNGFPGNTEINMEKFKEAQEPTNFAISLSGEPTIYSKLDGLIEELNKRKKFSFLVTNGQFPERLEKLESLPTQLYVSLDAPTKELYQKIDRPSLKDFWERFNKTLELLPTLDTRKVLRLTAVKGLNMTKVEEYAKLIEKANVDWIEIKAYMWVGESRNRLKEENMPTHNDIQEFSKQIAEKIEMDIIDEQKESRVCLLAEKDSRERFL
ncbi:MAG: 4-demethylwyosine synthase TYW1 [Candidatus Aenigmarchaeota archaeon]|nr:4-demethylwyosine synthase TYW1 [Candidatus Aenigmarchaeota archaeon]